MSEDAAVLNETEQVANDSGVTTEAEQTPASAVAAQPAKDGDDEPDQHGKEGGYQRIKRQRDEARAREEYWRDRAQQSAVPKTQPAPEATEVEEVAPKKPKSADFATVDEFLEANDAYLEERLAYEKKQIVKAVKTDLSKTEQQKAIERKEQERKSAYAERAKAFAAETPDFEAALDGSNVRVNNATQAAINESDIGPALVYYLAKNEAEAERIYNLSPIQAAVAMGKIEASLAKEKPADGEEAEVKPQPLKTAAPAPPTPVRKTSSAPAEPDLDKMPYKEFVKHREAQQKKGK
jgi:hypothetical protein